MDISIGDRILALNLHGIVVKRDERRDYPGADLAANLVGFTGADNSGLEGLEGRYDSLLRGTAGSQEFEIGKGDLNTPIPGGYQKYVEPQPGTSLQLTIDADVQRATEEGFHHFGYNGAAVILDAFAMTDVELGRPALSADFLDLLTDRFDEFLRDRSQQTNS